MYTKLYRSITSSSVWIEDSDTIKVWVFLLAEADRKGFVFGSVVGVADRCKVPLGKAQAVLRKFTEPDPYSGDLTRAPQNEGRRIEPIDGGWRLLNFEHYRDLADADVRRDQVREANKRLRERNKKGPRKRDQARSPVITGDTSRSSEIPSDATTTPDAEALEHRNPAAPQPEPTSASRTWHGVKLATLPVLRMLDSRLRRRDPALKLPDDIGAVTTKALNTAMARLPAEATPERVRFAVYWAFDDRWYADKIRDVLSLIGNLRPIISGSADAWKTLRNDLQFLDEVQP